MKIAIEDAIEQDAAIELALIDLARDAEYQGARRRVLSGWRADLRMLWVAPEPPKKSTRLPETETTTPSPTSKTPRYEADSPACGLNSKGKKSHKKLVAPKMCLDCGMSIIASRKRCEGCALKRERSAWERHARRRPRGTILATSQPAGCIGAVLSVLGDQNPLESPVAPVLTHRDVLVSTEQV